jgi:hypothetical protein
MQVILNYMYRARDSDHESLRVGDPGLRRGDPWIALLASCRGDLEIDQRRA